MSTKNSKGSAAFISSLTLAVALAICGSSTVQADDGDFNIDIAPFSGGSLSGQSEQVTPGMSAPGPLMVPKPHAPVYQPLSAESTDSASFFADHRAEMKREAEKAKKERAARKAAEELAALEEEEEEDAELTDEERAAKHRDEKRDKEIDKATEEADGKEFEWDKSPKLESDDPHHFLRKAQFYVKHEQYKQALHEINNALTLQPNLWEAHHLGARILHLQGREKEAIVRYRQYLDVCPDDISANINLGGLLRKAGNLIDAEKYCKKAVAINFYSCEAHYALSKVYFDKGDQSAAFSELTKCMVMDKNNAGVHNDIGVIYQKRGYLEEAQEEYIKALRLEPANKTYLRNLELLRERMKGQQPVKHTNAADLL